MLATTYAAMGQDMLATTYAVSKGAEALDRAGLQADLLGDQLGYLLKRAMRII
jgi:hypothetical protein